MSAGSTPDLCSSRYSLARKSPTPPLGLFHHLLEACQNFLAASGSCFAHAIQAFSEQLLVHRKRDRRSE